MKRYFGVLLSALCIVFVLGSSAQAANAHLVKGPDVTTSGNTLTITASIAGLGNVPSADFSLTGTVDVSSRCYTKSGNKPQAANKQETINVDQSGTFPVRNGRTDVSFSVSPLSTLTCPGGQHVVIESVSYNLLLSGQGISVPITS
jgi:hypothetical protein